MLPHHHYFLPLFPVFFCLSTSSICFSFFFTSPSYFPSLLYTIVSRNSAITGPYYNSSSCLSPFFYSLASCRISSYFSFLLNLFLISFLSLFYLSLLLSTLCCFPSSSCFYTLLLFPYRLLPPSSSPSFPRQKEPRPNISLPKNDPTINISLANGCYLSQRCILGLPASPRRFLVRLRLTTR